MILKVLFIRFSSLGDIMLTEPCVRLAETLLPGFQVDYLTKPEYVDLVRQFQNIHTVYTWENKLRLIRKLRAEEYTYIIDLQDKFNSFLLRLLLPAKKKVIYKKQHFLRWLMVKKLTSKVIDSVVYNYLDTLKKLPEAQNPRSLEGKGELPEYTCRGGMGGIKLPHTILNKQDIYPQLTPRAEYIERAKEIFESYHIPLLPKDDQHITLAVFPGATHFTKQYPLEKFANFLLSIPEEWNISILIMGNWDEKLFALKLKSLTGIKMFDLTGAFSIKLLPAAISLCDVVVTNDSGPMHLAAALNKPQVAVFCATHTRLGFRPLNDKAVILQSSLKCRPCSLHGGKRCKKRHMKCMYDVHSEEVFEAVVRELEIRS